MLVLAMRVGDQTYALPTRAIVEVVPLVALRRIPRAPACLAGTCNYRGRIAPVVDLSELLIGKPCRQRLSTRIVFVEGPADHEGVLGLMAEGVTETFDLDPAALEAGTTVRTADTPYLRAVVQHEVGQVQMFDADALRMAVVRMPQFPLALEGD